MLSDDEFTRLYRAAVETLTYWMDGGARSLP